MTKMYEENIKSINWFVGCGHDCVYCEPSFQRQAKRSRKHCQKHYDYEPHSHLEKLSKAPPKTNANEFVFFPSLGDPSFASVTELSIALDYVKKFKETTFLMQTKAPCMFLLSRKFPENLILGITLETNKRYFKTPSLFRDYRQMSYAPLPTHRAQTFVEVEHFRKAITVEPILDFTNNIFEDMIEAIEPEIVYVGYDNHNCKLPEPFLSKTELLIERLEEFTEVRVKTLRNPWWKREGCGRQEEAQQKT